MILLRVQFNADGILGRLLDADRVQLAATMEHSYDGIPKLPAGTYRCLRGVHRLPHRPDHPFETFEVMGVPGHTGILFHVGNFNRDSDGCILLGRTATMTMEGWPMLTQSQTTFDRFMLDLEGVSSFSLQVQDGIPV
jgi:hypothetical protein